MLLINCEISLQLKWCKDRFLVPGFLANQVSELKINDAKLYVSLVNLETQDNVR